MAINAWEKIGESTVDNLVIDSMHPLDTIKVTLATGTGTLKRGTLINTSGSICNSTTVGSAETFDTPNVILCQDVKLSSTATTPAMGYITGCFNSDYVIVGDDVEVSDFYTECRKLGIILK